MPITLAKIAANTATAVMTIGEETVAITYYPGRVTERTMSDLQVIGDPTKTDIAINAKALNETVIQLVKSWEVLNDDGTMYPIDLDHLSYLPYLFRVNVLVAILGDMRPNAEVPATENLLPSVAG